MHSLFIWFKNGHSPGSISESKHPAPSGRNVKHLIKNTDKFGLAFKTSCFYICCHKPSLKSAMLTLASKVLIINKIRKISVQNRPLDRSKEFKMIDVILDGYWVLALTSFPKYKIWVKENNSFLFLLNIVGRYGNTHTFMLLQNNTPGLGAFCACFMYSCIMTFTWLAKTLLGSACKYIYSISCFNNLT